MIESSLRPATPEERAEIGAMAQLIYTSHVEGRPLFEVLNAMACAMVMAMEACELPVDVAVPMVLGLTESIIRAMGASVQVINHDDDDEERPHIN